MKRKAYKRHKRRAHRLFKQWIPVLGLGYWHIEIDWYDDTVEFAKGENRTTAMRIDTDWHYCRARVSVCVPMIATLDDATLDWAVCHELCHALVNELREPDGDRKHEERVATMLAKAFIWTRDYKGDDNAT
jgi:hypothetical protein